MTRPLVPLLALGALGCNDATLGKADRPPQVDIVSPLDGATFDAGEPLVLCAQVSDEEDLGALAMVFQSSVDGLLWEGTGVPESCEGGNAGLTVSLSAGGAHTLSVTVVDPGGQSGEATITVSPTTNSPPACSIDSPEDGSVWGVEGVIPFEATATDAESDPAALTGVLSSDVDGQLWAGSPTSSGAVSGFDLTLTPGAHTLTLTVTDPGGRVDVCGSRVTVEGCDDDDLDEDGVTACDGDCDDANPDTYPGAPELADGADNDCNDLVDDGTALVDDDGDGWAEIDGDCDDTDADIRPDATEVWYNGVDEDCDGRDDDRDGDGVDFAEDCDDDDASRSPDAAEVWYDGVDQDCDGNDDDQDGDGFAVSVDCNDTAATVNPDAAEIWYNGTDENCDGNDTDRDEDGFDYSVDCDDTDASVNPSAAEVWYNGTDEDCDGTDDDQDSDGFDYTVDCDDTNASVNPSATEVWYNGTDEDCDGNDDDRDEDGYAYGVDCDDTDDDTNPGAAEIWYNGTDEDCDGNDTDRDEDGYAYTVDCDDTDADENPGATEIWYNGTDEDCDGNDDDRDEDGYDYTVDCDDLDASQNPGAAEVWYNGVDEDCDGNDTDRDEDGYTYAGDCDDTDASVNPAAAEVWYNGVDEDCDGNDDDQDEDGYALADDCDDTDDTANPDGTEARDGADNDCDGVCDEGVMTAGELFITEIMRDPSAVLDENGEYFEVYNASSTDINLCGWTLRDAGTDTTTVSGDVYVGAGEYAVLTRNASSSANGGIASDYGYGNSLQMGNGADDEIILAVAGVTVDEVYYLSSFFGGSGYSAELRSTSFSATGNNSASGWCTATTTYGSGDRGTPGLPNGC